MSEKEGVKKISDWERKRREHNLRQSNASVELEGFKILDEIKELDQRYIDGELSMKELSDLVIGRMMEMAKNVNR